MNYLNIPVPKDTNVVVCGDIHEHKEQFDKIINVIRPNKTNWFVSVGDVYDKGFGVEVAESIVDIIRGIVDDGCGWFVKGNHELKYQRHIKQKKLIATEQFKWILNQPIAISFRFYNGNRLTVLHGGVQPNYTWDHLENDVSIAYIRALDDDGKYIKYINKKIDGKSVLVPNKPSGITWHKKYDGRFGYIASGHNSQKDGKPKFYNYSCNLDTACYFTGKLTAQVFNHNGKGELITVTGTAKHLNSDEFVGQKIICE